MLVEYVIVHGYSSSWLLMLPPDPWDYSPGLPIRPPIRFANRRAKRLMGRLSAR